MVNLGLNLEPGSSVSKDRKCAVKHIYSTRGVGVLGLSPGRTAILHHCLVVSKLGVGGSGWSGAEGGGIGQQGEL